MIKQRSQLFSATTDIRTHFNEDLQKRDPNCVFTDWDPVFCNGIHIIPFARTTEVCVSFIDYIAIFIMLHLSGWILLSRIGFEVPTAPLNLKTLMILETASLYNLVFTACLMHVNLLL